MPVIGEVGRRRGVGRRKGRLDDQPCSPVHLFQFEGQLALYIPSQLSYSLVVLLIAMLEMEVEYNPELDAIKTPMLVMVDGGRRLGRCAKLAGSFFDLKGLLGENARILGSDKFSEVYLRVNGQNILRLDERGRVIDMAESREAKEMLYHPLSQDEVAALAAEKIIVGRPFKWGNNKTKPVAEVVWTTPRMYNRDHLEMMTGKRKSGIIDEFRAALTEIDSAEDEFLAIAPPPTDVNATISEIVESSAT